MLYCPHSPDTGCSCRKPRPGLLHAALTRMGAVPDETVLVGDHESDLLAAEAVGCWSLHVRSGRGAFPGRWPRGCLGSVRDLRAATLLLLDARAASHGRERGRREDGG
ncbi:HAD hydrolase-like protein [Streptomyces sp. NPDC039022]|uniref:HAD hydrolase-like protein n=1 Tax=Streptomyces sp. NPDC039022 TaxID=3157091 RepID=UPI0033C8E9EC